MSLKNQLFIQMILNIEFKFGKSFQLTCNHTILKTTDSYFNVQLRLFRFVE